MNTVLQQGEVTVDIGMLYDISGEDPDYIKMMVKTFLDTIPTTLAKIHTHYHEQDWDNLYRAAHYAKSSLSVIKISDLHAVAQTIETNAKTQTKLEELPVLIGKMANHIEVADQLLRTHFQLEA